MAKGDKMSEELRAKLREAKKRKPSLKKLTAADVHVAIDHMQEYAKEPVPGARPVGPGGLDMYEVAYLRRVAPEVIQACRERLPHRRATIYTLVNMRREEKVVPLFERRALTYLLQFHGLLEKQDAALGRAVYRDRTPDRGYRSRVLWV